MIKKLQRTLALLVISIFSLFAFGGSARAAGSLSVTIESAASWETGTTNSLSLYGTTSGAATSGFSFTVNLTNLKISNYDASGSPFSSNSVASGGAAGSSTITIFVGYSSPAGGTGKQFVGKLNVTGDTAGAASAQTTNIEAYDTDLEAMSGSGSTGNYTLISPPVADPPASSSSSSSSTSNTSTSTAPAPTKVAILNTAGEPTIVTQEEAAAIVTEQAPDVVTESKPVVAKKKLITPLRIAGAVGIVVLLAVLAKVGLVLRKKKLNRIADIPMSSLTEPIVSSPSPVTPTPTSEQPPETIIRPTTNNVGSDVNTRNTPSGT